MNDRLPARQDSLHVEEASTRSLSEIVRESNVVVKATVLAERALPLFRYKKTKSAKLSREVKRVVTDGKHPNVIVGLCGHGFTIGSAEAAEEIEENPRAFHYYKPGFVSDLPPLYVKSEPWYADDGAGKPVRLKGYIQHDNVPFRRPYDTLGRLKGCCGKPEGSRPPWCPASRNIPQPDWDPSAPPERKPGLSGVGTYTLVVFYEGEGVLYEGDGVLRSGVVEGSVKKAKKAMRKIVRAMYAAEREVPPHPSRVTGRIYSEDGSPHNEYYYAYDNKWLPEWRN